jgi:photosystem II stability/assembly factor-like uncharacterized protein
MAEGGSSGRVERLLDTLEWRNIGPFRGGRVVAVSGDPDQRNVFYFGSTGGGVWKTTDAGLSWRNVSDGFFKRASVGALAVAPSDPNVIYAGMGEACIRGNVSHGDGVYRSTDAGASWNHLGLAPTRHIGRVRVHPGDPDVVYVAALGHAFGPNPERGVYRSQDGGSSWDLVLYRSPDAGAIDLVIDPMNPRTVYATTWETRRTFWNLNSGGPGSGLFKSTDGGDTWKEISRARGLPKGTLGRIGVAVSPARSGRVWALIEADDGAVFCSDDGGETWQRHSEQPDLRFRAWYYQHIYADPLDPDTIWILNIESWRSIDAGRTFTKVATQHGDAHDLWFDPCDSRRLILGDDGGASVSLDGGQTWSSLMNQPTAEIYHVSVDNRVPYRVLGAQQDNSTISVPSRSYYPGITPLDSYSVGGGESGYVEARPDNPDVIYAGSISTLLTRYDHRTRETRDITIWPQSAAGTPAADLKYRFAWTFPIAISPHDPDTIYVGGNHVFRSRDEGRSWEAISPDLTRNDASKLGSSGGELTPDNTSAEYYCTVYTISESPVEAGVIWAGTDDGRVHVTRDAGKSWQDVTPAELPEWGMISIVSASPHDAAAAYVSATRHKHDDFKPYLFKTTDHGGNWSMIVAGIPADEYTRVIREDPIRPGLLYAGTEAGIYASVDAGVSWRPIKGDLPVVPIHDLVVKDGDLVAATHGRSFWILDDLTPLREFERSWLDKPAHLFKPMPTFRFRLQEGFPREPVPGVNYQYVGPLVLMFTLEPAPGSFDRRRRYLNAGANPPNAVVVQYHLGEIGDERVKLTFSTAAGEVIRSLTSKTEAEAEKKPPPGIPAAPDVPHRPGLNRFAWDMRHAPAPHVEKDTPRYTDVQGPHVPPGKYEVRIEVGDYSQTETFEIVPDPTTGARAEDLQAQYALRKELWQALSNANRSVNLIRDLKAQLELWVGDRLPDDDPVKQAASGLASHLAEVEVALVGEKVKGHERISRPISLTGKLAALGTSVGAGDRSPTSQAGEAAADLIEQARTQMSRLDAVLESEVTEFNTLVKQKESPALTVGAARSTGKE